jgi:hypothetical protein
MIFSENTQVIYKQLYGFIDFVCDSYVVIQVQPNVKRNPARLLVFRENYKEIEILKASTK